MKRHISQLREALIDLTGLLNRPQPDAALIARAGVELDRALLPLLVRVERRGPLGVGELAELCGRDSTTVSRQIAKLEDMGLVSRRVNGRDARVRDVAVTERGRAMAGALDRARETAIASLLAEWDREEVGELARLLRKFANDALKRARAERIRSS